MAEAPYAIYRHAKLKSMGLIHASAQHMTRQRDTPNADPARRDQNMVLIGGDDPAADVAALVPALDARGEDGRRLRRSNSVLAIEVLLTASPEWWAAADADAQQAWLDRSTEWLVSEYGRENIAHLRLHGDERTPHLTGFIVPLDPEGGGLNARRWIGGAHRCAQQQTDYAAVVEPLGLRRGVEGSTAEHERVKRHYGQIAAPVTELKIERPPRLIIDPEGWATEQAASVAQQAAPALARAQTAESDRTARKSAVAQATKERGRRERAEASLERQKAVTDRMRALPLPDVLDALGFQQDKAEPDRWRAEGFNVTIGTGQKAGKWWDHAAQTGRGGAIDLTAHALGCDFKGALAWLSDRFGPGPTAADLTARMRAEAVAQVKAAIAEREPFTPPAPTTEHWPEVRRHLTADRALPAPYIDRLHELGDCYADARRNAVFLCRDEAGRVVGAEMKGTVKRSDGAASAAWRRDRPRMRAGSASVRLQKPQRSIWSNRRSTRSHWPGCGRRRVRKALPSSRPQARRRSRAAGSPGSRRPCGACAPSTTTAPATKLPRGCCAIALSACAREARTGTTICEQRRKDKARVARQILRRQRKS